MNPTHRRKTQDDKSGEGCRHLIYHLEGEARARANDGEHEGVAEDVHREVLRRSHGVGATHVLRIVVGSRWRTGSTANRSDIGIDRSSDEEESTTPKKPQRQGLQVVAPAPAPAPAPSAENRMLTSSRNVPLVYRKRSHDEMARRGSSVTRDLRAVPEKTDTLPPLLGAAPRPLTVPHNKLRRKRFNRVRFIANVRREGHDRRGNGIEAQPAKNQPPSMYHTGGTEFQLRCASSTMRMAKNTSGTAVY